MVGHSLGEYAAACVAEVFSLEDALRLVVRRGRLMQNVPIPGVAAAVFASQERVAEALGGDSAEVAIAAINGPDRVLITGTLRGVETLSQRLQDQGIEVRKLTGMTAAHSPLMDPMLDQFEQDGRSVSYSLPRIPLVSTLLGRLVRGDEVCHPRYWRQHVRQPVQFFAAMEALSAQDCDAFIEIGPRQTLLRLGQLCLPHKKAAWLPSLSKERGSWEQITRSLGDLYLQGAPIDWKGFDAGYERTPVSLPTYPFQRTRFWMGAALDSDQESTPYVPQRMGAARGLLGQRQRAAIRETIFESTCAYSASPLFSDHLLYDLPIVAGAVHLSRLIEAGAAVLKQAPIALDEIIFPQPMILPRQEEARTSQLVLSPDTHGRYSFHLVSLGAEENAEEPHWQSHAIGRMGLSPQSPRNEPLPMASSLVASFIARCGEGQHGDAFYKEQAARGYQLGPSFQWLHRFWIAETEALCELRPPPDLQSWEATDAPVDGRRLLHPGLLDSCIQAATRLDARRDPADPASLHVLLGLASLRFLEGSLAGTVFCHVRLRESSSELLIVDLDLFNEARAPLASLAGLRLQRASAQQLLRATRRDLAGSLYEVAWRPQARGSHTKVEPAGGRPQEAGGWLIFARQRGMDAALLEALRAENQRCDIVYPGAAYAAELDGSYTVCPGRGADFERLLTAVWPTEGHTHLHVLFLWGLQPPAIEDATEVMLDTALIDGCGSVLALIQAVVRRAPARPPRLWLVTRGAQAIGGETSLSGGIQSSLWGLGRVIASEHPRSWGGLIDLDPSPSASGDPGEEAAVLLHEIGQPDGETDIGYRAGQRYAARLASRPPPPSAPAALHADGTYLIVGGLGGLGLQLARWLLDSGARHLVLLGRRGAVAGPRAEALAELQGLGAQVRVVSADAASLQELGAVLQQIDETMPPLKGIIHAAGIIEDSLLVHQSWDSFARVLRPKVHGAHNLHLLTLQRELDFLIFFSSVAPLIGNPGQGSYAAANAFLDLLAHHRRSLGLRALSINWGPWEGDGMAAQVGDLFYKRWGLLAIPPKDGTALFGRLIQDAAAQLGVLPAHWSQLARSPSQFGVPRILSALVDQEAEAPSSIESGSEPAAAAPDDVGQHLLSLPPSDRRSYLFARIHELVTSVLGLDVSVSLDPQQRLSELGFDSLMAIDLVAALSGLLKLELPAMLLFNYPTLERLTDYLSKELLASSTNSGQTS